MIRKSYKTSKAQRLAVDTYNHRHKRRANRCRYKATAKSFINNQATKDELLYFKSLIHNRLKNYSD